MRMRGCRTSLERAAKPLTQAHIRKRVSRPQPWKPTRAHTHTTQPCRRPRHCPYPGSGLGAPSAAGPAAAAATPAAAAVAWHADAPLHPGTVRARRPGTEWTGRGVQDRHVLAIAGMGRANGAGAGSACEHAAGCCLRGLGGEVSLGRGCGRWVGSGLRRRHAVATCSGRGEHRTYAFPPASRAGQKVGANMGIHRSRG